jgi:hypothetical protein
MSEIWNIIVFLLIYFYFRLRVRTNKQYGQIVDFFGPGPNVLSSRNESSLVCSTYLIDVIKGLLLRDEVICTL